MNPTLTNLLGALELGASITMKVAGGDVAAGAGIADGILSMIQKAVAAYESHTRQPIDLALLAPSAPLTQADVAANESATLGMAIAGDPVIDPAVTEATPASGNAGSTPPASPST